MRSQVILALLEEPITIRHRLELECALVRAWLEERRARIATQAAPGRTGRLRGAATSPGAS